VKEGVTAQWEHGQEAQNRGKWIHGTGFSLFYTPFQNTGMEVREHTLSYWPLLHRPRIYNWTRWLQGLAHDLAIPISVDKSTPAQGWNKTRSRISKEMAAIKD